MATWLRNAKTTTSKPPPRTGGPLKQLAQQGFLGFIPQLAASLEDVIPGGFEGAKKRVSTKLKEDPLSFTPLSMRESVVPATVGLGKAVGNKQAGEDIGYALRGALSLSPIMQRPKSLGGKLALTTPTTSRQQLAERIGRTTYGTALTLPIGGAAAIPGRVAAGATLGAGMSAVPELLKSAPKLDVKNALLETVLHGSPSVKTITKGLQDTEPVDVQAVGEAVKRGGLSGVENSWILAFTGLGLDKALGVATTKVPALAKFTSANTGATLKALGYVTPEAKKQLLIEGGKRLLGRAMLETLPENTAFTFLDKLKGEDARPFFQAWFENLPGALAGNLLYAGASFAAQGTYNWNKKDIDAAVQAFNKASEETTAAIPGLKAQDITKQLTEGATPRQIELLKQAQSKTIDISDIGELQTFLRSKGFEFQQGKIVPTAQVGAGAGARPAHQVQLEQAADAGDMNRVRQILDSIPEDDPYKKPMEDSFRPRVEAAQGQENLQRLRTAEQSGDQAKVQQITDEIRAEGQQSESVQKIITALEGAKKTRGKQEALYGTVRSAQTPELAAIQAEGSGEAGFTKQLGTLKGELPKAEFTGVRNQLTQTDVDSLFKQIQTTDQLDTWQKIPAQKGLAKLLQPEGGRVPTKGEIRLLNEVFGEDFTDAVLSNQPAMQKYMRNATEVINVPRALMASVDMSAPLRQGWLLIPRRLMVAPKQTLGELGDMFKMFVSEDAYKASIDEIEARPTYKLMEDSGLSITKINDPLLTGREEAFISNYAEEIPGVGRLVRASDRAYTGFLNQLRADTFDSLLKSAQEDPNVEITPKLTGDIAKFVNSASGRGDLGGLKKHTLALNNIFFSPRLIASRVNAINPGYYASLDPYVRKEAVKSLVTSVGTAVAVLGMAKLAGAEVTADPTNANFGKIKIGNTRIDVTGGFGPYARLIAQFMSGKITDSTTGRVIPLTGEGNNPSRWDLITRSLSYKRAPVVNFAVGLLSGKDVLGQEFKVAPEIVESFVPLFLQDLFEAMREHGLLRGMALATPGFFGAGVQTYGTKIPTQETTPGGKPTIKYREKPGVGESTINLITGQQSSTFTPQQQEQMWKAELQKRIQEVQRDQSKNTVQQPSGGILDFLNLGNTAPPTTGRSPVWTR